MSVAVYKEANEKVSAIFSILNDKTFMHINGVTFSKLRLTIFAMSIIYTGISIIYMSITYLPPPPP